MKNRYILFTIFFITLATLANISQAQVAPAAPDKVFCSGTDISIKGPVDPNTNAPFPAYQWYKVDASGTATLVSTQIQQTYTETQPAPGYYRYQIKTVNANSCESPISDVYTVLVLPPLTASITATNNAQACSEKAGQVILTASPTSPSNGYNLKYQWTRKGVPIPNATDISYTVPAENISTDPTVTYGVTITYDVPNSPCSSSASQVITIVPLPTQPVITAN